MSKKKATTMMMKLSDAVEYIKDTHQKTIAKSTLQSQIKNGVLEAEKMFGIWVVSEKELDRYVAEHLGRFGQALEEVE